MNIYVHRTYEPFKFLGRLFWVPLSVKKGTPPVTYTATWEVDKDHRWGPTIVVRIPLTRLAIGLGVWLDSGITDLDREQAIRDKEQEDIAFDIYQAVNGPTNHSAWIQAREEVAALGLDPDEEMEMMQQKGIFGS